MRKTKETILLIKLIDTDELTENVVYAECSIYLRWYQHAKIRSETK